MQAKGTLPPQLPIFKIKTYDEEFKNLRDSNFELHAQLQKSEKTVRKLQQSKQLKSLVLASMKAEMQEKEDDLQTIKERVEKEENQQAMMKNLLEKVMIELR